MWKKEGVSKDGSAESREEENELSVSCSINSTVLWEFYKGAIREMCEGTVNTLSPPDCGNTIYNAISKTQLFLAGLKKGSVVSCESED